MAGKVRAVTQTNRLAGTKDKCIIKTLMKDDLAKINLDEYQLDPAIRRLFERFLNHIEVLTKENRELKEEKQQLRDEIARLKGEKGQPKIKANKKEEKRSGADEEKKKQIKPTEEKEAPAPAKTYRPAAKSFALCCSSSSSTCLLNDSSTCAAVGHLNALLMLFSQCLCPISAQIHRF